MRIGAGAAAAIPDTPDDSPADVITASSSSAVVAYLRHSSDTSSA